MMSQFTRGWKWNWGLVTLCLSLLLAIGWIRSDDVTDTISFSPHRFTHAEIVSRSGRLQWHRYSLVASGPEFESYEYPVKVSSIDNRILAMSSPSLLDTLVWHQAWLGFGYGTSRTHLTGMSAEVWTVPYWALVVPLTLLTALLFMARHREMRGSPAEAIPRIGESP